MELSVARPASRRELRGDIGVDCGPGESCCVVSLRLDGFSASDILLAFPSLVKLTGIRTSGDNKQRECS